MTTFNPADRATTQPLDQCGSSEAPASGTRCTRCWERDSHKPVDVAASGAEALRSLCHITQSADSFEYAQDIYLTIGQLDELSSLLRQAIDQTRRALQRRAVQGDVYDDRGVDPTETVRRCTEAMRDAEAHTTAVAVPLSHAKELASHLGGGRRPTRGLE